MNISKGVLFLAIPFAFAATANPNSSYVTKIYPTKHARGLVRTEESSKALAAMPRISFVKSDATIPGTFSMRGQAGPVEDQGSCGTCWDFSLTTALRGTLMMDGQDPGRLSFNYLLDCATEYQGCNGGDFPAAAHFINPQGGPAYGSDGDYTGTQSACQQEKSIASAAKYYLLGNDMGANAGGTTPSFKDIAYVLSVLNHPVSIDVAAEPWEMYSSGTMDTCVDFFLNQIDHMVVVEGFDCETSVDANGNCVFDANGNLPPGVGTWLIRNSWGTSWGDQGYITTKATDSKGKLCNSVASDALFYDLDGTLGPIASAKK